MKICTMHNCSYSDTRAITDPRRLSHASVETTPPVSHSFLIRLKWVPQPSELPSHRHRHALVIGCCRIPTAQRPYVVDCHSLVSAVGYQPSLAGPILFRLARYGPVQQYHLTFSIRFIQIQYPI
jgi:hypothetical protein